MPRFSFRCTECNVEFSISANERLPKTSCKTCGAEAKNIFKVNGGVSVMERLDNGLMGRAVERLHNIEEIITDVADNDSARHKQMELNDGE